MQKKDGEAERSSAPSGQWGAVSVSPVPPLAPAWAPGFFGFSPSAGGMGGGRYLARGEELHPRAPTPMPHSFAQATVRTPGWRTAPTTAEANRDLIPCRPGAHRSFIRRAWKSP